uniref:Uncharacterized protein n=1 Tax=Anisakis simplex TaxID=6269 RepID=A0A0M3JB66_ANISI
LEKQRQSLIAEALKNVDSPASKSKKIVFNSDSEDENQTTSRAPVENSSSTQNNSNIRLFDNDGDEADEDNVELSIKNRHFGPKGAKLMALEAKFGNDERFRMNEKFLDEDKTNEEEVDGEAMELAKEKKTEFEILSKVLGRTIRSTKLNENAVASSQKKAPFLRFDPDNPAHVKWLNEQQQLNHAKVFIFSNWFCLKH